ncbi:serine/threonine-protein kinase [Actinomyces oricola]|uniref:serine/threonine-protein kinase n=1 Tax=Actinomyces oricola TaxID=206043 RepID=UPI000FFF0AFD|nr:serine/threonine-protein kinase [Actinomyces oricola]
MKPVVGLEIQGRYRLVERIALGGMGEVWRATDLRSGRAVAAKILRPELIGDEIFLSRLRAEAVNSRGLRHPNLAMVLDAGERDGSGWIIMELVQGRPLSEVLAEKGTMPPAQILPILAQVARALQVVHDSGVVHRDVKPSNILINREGLAKLTDFGISTGLNQRPMTASGMVMGTAQYLAPEQAMGSMATPAGDLYALGIIAYEALTGRRPFTGTTQVDIAFAHVNQQVPPLPDAVPEEVQELVMELLAKKPQARPHSARELARRLDRIVINLPADAWDPHDPLQWRSTRRPEVSLVGPGLQGGHQPASSVAVAEAERHGALNTVVGTGRHRRGSVPDVPLHPGHPGAGSSGPGRSGPSRRRAVVRSAPSASSAPGTGAASRRRANRDSGHSQTRGHRSSRRFLGLPVAVFVLLAIGVVTAVILIIAAGTLASASPASPPFNAVAPISPTKEAL